MNKLILFFMVVLFGSFASATPILWENLFFDTFDDSSYTNQGWVQGNPTIAETGGEVGCSSSPGCSMYQNFTNISWASESWQFWAILDQDSTSPPNFNRVGFGRGVDFNFVNDEIVITNDMASNSFNVVGYGACSAISYSESPGNDLLPHNISVIYNASNNEYRVYRDDSLRTTFTSTCIDYQPHWIHNSRQTTAEMEEFQILVEAAVINNSVIETYPPDGEHFNFYNGSIVLDSTVDPMTCSLNNTDWVLQNTAPNVSIHFKHLNTTNLTEQEYDIFYNCTFTDLATDNGSINFTIDRTFPTVDLITPLNNSINNTNFTFTFNTFDLFLYRVNATITRDSDSVQVFANDSGAFSGNTMWWNFTEFIDISNGSYPDGDYTVRIEAADQHTDRNWTENIPEVRRDLPGGRNGLDLYLSNGIFTIDTPAGSTITTRRTIDRMHFNHTGVPGVKIMFIEADHLVYLPDSPYLGHFVINNRYWFDVEGLDDVTISEVTQNRYRIRYTQNSDWVESRSLGGLNQINVTTSFSLDTTPPFPTVNNTIAFGSRATINITGNESFSYNYSTVVGGCAITGGFVHDSGSSPVSSLNHIFNTSNLNSNTTYRTLVTMADALTNNATYCFEFTTQDFDIKITALQIVQDNINTEIDFQCTALDVESRDVLYGYHIQRDNTTILQNFTRGTGNGINHFNASGVDFPERGVDGNLTTFAFFDAAGEWSYYNISKNVQTTDSILNVSYTMRFENTNAPSCSDPGLYCLTEPGNLTTAVFLENITARGAIMDQVFTIANQACLNHSYETFEILVNTTQPPGCSFPAFELYEIYNTTVQIDQSLFTPHNISTDVVVLSSFIDGNYSFECFAFNGNNFAQQNATAVQIPSIVFSIYDEETGQLITAPATITFVADDPSINFNRNVTFSGGSTTIDFLSSIDYNILYEVDNYTKRHYFLSSSDLILNGTFNLFLLNESVGGFSILRVIDQNLDPVESAIVRIRKNIPNFNAKQTIGITKSNFEGESTFDFKRHTDNYQFIVELNNEVVLTSTESQVSKEIVKIQVQITTDPFTSLKIFSNASSSIEIVNGTTSNKTCNYFYSGADIVEACVRVIERDLTQNDLQICEVCSNALSNTISCDFNTSTTSLYICQGLIDTNTTSSWITTQQATYKFLKGASTYFQLGLLVALFLILGLAFLFRQTPSLMIMAALFGLIIAYVGSFISIPFGALMLIIILGGIIIILMRN